MNNMGSHNFNQATTVTYFSSFSYRQVRCPAVLENLEKYLFLQNILQAVLETRFIMFWPTCSVPEEGNGPKQHITG
jgi:hypothetical protein